MSLKQELLEWIDKKESGSKILSKKQVMIIFGVSYNSVNLAWEYFKGNKIIKCEQGKICIKI